MTPLNLMEVRCLSCGTWNRAMIQFGDLESFESSHMSGNRQQCSKCGTMTPIDKPNIRFTRSDGKGGFVGNDTTL